VACPSNVTLVVAVTAVKSLGRPLQKRLRPCTCKGFVTQLIATLCHARLAFAATAGAWVLMWSLWGSGACVCRSTWHSAAGHRLPSVSCLIVHVQVHRDTHVHLSLFTRSPEVAISLHVRRCAVWEPQQMQERGQKWEKMGVSEGR
jgi:hypothetical protein